MKVSLEDPCFIHWMKIEDSSFICVLVLHWKWLNYESQTLNTLDETHPAIVIPNLKSTKKESEYKWSPHKIVQLMKQSPMWRRFGFNIARDTLKSNYTDTPCFHLHSKVVCCGFCLEKLYLASIVHLLPPKIQ